MAKRNVGFSPSEIIRLKSAMNQMMRSREGQLDSLRGLQGDLVQMRQLRMLLNNNRSNPIFNIGKAKKIEFPESLSYDDMKRLDNLRSFFGRNFTAKRYGS
jgi:hypothetical protein